MIEVKKLGRFRTVSFANYHGPARDFHPSVMRQTGGGAVVCMGCEKEFNGGFAAFRESCLAAEIHDEVYESQRHLRCRWNGRLVEALWDMQSEYLYWMRNEAGFVPRQRLAYGPA